MDILMKDITKIYGDKKVLDGLTLGIKEGEITCIMAPSGYGKTTLLHCLMGLIQVDEGAIEGVPEKISAVFQEDRLCEQFSAITNVEMVCSRSVPKSEIQVHLQEVGLMDSMRVPVGSLSGGMKRRVAIVRACMADSDFVIFDEPFKGMDVDTKETMIAYMKKYQNNRTMLVITHNKQDVELLGGKLEMLGAVCVKKTREIPGL